MSAASALDLKSVDQQVALAIGGLGGMPTRDRRGNVLETLWVKYSEQSVVGMLLETNDIRKILLEQIQAQLKARRDLIQEVEQNEVVCQWLLDFTSSWEREYSRKIVVRFDIGQLVLSAMSEAYFEVAPLLSRATRMPGRCAHSYMIKCVDKAVTLFEDKRRAAETDTAAARSLVALADADKARQIAVFETSQPASSHARLLAAATAEHSVVVEPQYRIIAQKRDACEGCVHTGDDAVVRVLFRLPYTKTLMVRIAGAVLRKQEVCNRAGGYSAKVQRNDVSQQKNAALDTFCAWILDDDLRLKTMFEVMDDPEKLVGWIHDHKGSQKASDGNHYAHGPAHGSEAGTRRGPAL